MYKLCLNSRDELLMIDLEQVAYFQADRNYTQIYYIAAKGPLVSIGLSKLEEYISMTWPREQRSPMVRLGRSLIINQRYVAEISILRQRIVLSDNAGHTYTLNAPKPLLKQYKEILSGQNSRQSKPLSNES